MKMYLQRQLGFIITALLLTGIISIISLFAGVNVFGPSREEAAAALFTLQIGFHLGLISCWAVQ